jgi:hypothetical protein
MGRSDRGNPGGAGRDHSVRSLAGGSAAGPCRPGTGPLCMRGQHRRQPVDKRPTGRHDSVSQCALTRHNALSALQLIRSSPWIQPREQVPGHGRRCRLAVAVSPYGAAGMSPAAARSTTRSTRTSVPPPGTEPADRPGRQKCQRCGAPFACVQEAPPSTPMHHDRRAPHPPPRRLTRHTRHGFAHRPTPADDHPPHHPARGKGVVPPPPFLSKTLDSPSPVMHRRRASNFFDNGGS